MKRVLLDCDVVLDVLLKRQPFVLTSPQVLDAVVTAKIGGYLAGHAVTNVGSSGESMLIRREISSTHCGVRLSDKKRVWKAHKSPKLCCVGGLGV